MATALYFTTGNTMLAQALIQCGASFVRLANIYDAQTLKRLGFKTAREAWQAGKPGKITYFFEQDELLKRLIKVFDETQAAIDKGDSIEVQPDVEDVMRILCTGLKQRKTFLEAWKTVTPLVQIPNEGQSKTSTHGGVTTVESPGFRLVSINASSATKKRLNL